GERVGAGEAGLHVRGEGRGRELAGVRRGRGRRDLEDLGGAAAERGGDRAPAVGRDEDRTAVSREGGAAGRVERRAGAGEASDPRAALAGVVGGGDRGRAGEGWRRARPAAG